MLNLLTDIERENSEYWAYLSNCCIQLDLYDRAMSSLRRALVLPEEEEGWMLHNMGNMLNNRGLYSEAISWLERGLAIEPSSEYAPDNVANVNMILTQV